MSGLSAADAAGEGRMLLTGVRSFEFVAGAPPPGRPGWVTIRPAFCGLCGSDMSKWEGRRPLDQPHSMGHEFVAVMNGATVVSDLNYHCGHCPACERGEEHLCDVGQHSRFTNRGFATAIRIDPSYLVEIPERDPTPELALAEPLSCALHAVHWAVAPRADHERTLVVGAGGLGLCVSFALSVLAPGLGFDLVDVVAERPAKIADAGAKAQPVAPDDVGAAAYDVVIDVSGTPEGLASALRACRRGGRLVSMSHLDGYGPTDFVLPALTRSDITFKASYLNGGRRRLLEAVDLLTSHWSPSWNPTLLVVPLAELETAFADRRSTGHPKTVIATGKPAIATGKPAIANGTAQPTSIRSTP